MFKKIFTKLCSERGVAPTAVCSEIGLSNAAYSCWTDESVPRKTTLYKLANYFNVSVDYLLGKEDSPLPQDTTGFTVADQSKVRMIPVYDTASAGFGALASSQPSEYTPMYFENTYEADNTICIRVKGDSMSPVVNNGDLVHVLKQDIVDRGSMAVVLVDDEGFVKYIEYGAGWIELRSANPAYSPMRYEGTETERVRIVGLVTGSTRRNTPGMKHTGSGHSSGLEPVLRLTDQMTAEERAQLAAYAQFIIDRRGQ
jgi:repressor LexA